jgi:hypothetical protein
MPRKVGLGPPIIAIEAISTGKRLDLIDDFTGEDLGANLATKPAPTAFELTERDQRAKAARRKSIVTLLFSEPKPFKPFKRRI